MADYPKVCIFCGSPGPLSDEHVYGDWILKGGYAQRTANKHKLDINVLNPIGTPDTSRTITKAGDPLALNIRIVCEACNTQWMSDIQNKAKQHLRHLFENKPWVLGQPAQEAIATWAVMATMTSEYVAGDQMNLAISQVDRDYLRAHKKPPPGWRIWIGTYTRQNWKGQWVRTAAPILEADAAREEPTAPPNTQNTVFVVGNLFFSVLSFHFREDVELWNWKPFPRANALLAEIWPHRHGLIRWPREPLNDQDARGIASAFAAVFEAFRRRRAQGR